MTVLAVSASPALAEVRLVRAGDDLQAALNAARPGDELRLAPRAVFSGNFVLPVTAGSTYITVRSDLPDDTLPGPRQRVSPEMAASFARIVSPNTSPALRTAPGAHHWRLAFLEIPSTREGYGEIIQLGDGSGAQSSLEQVPYELVLDRLYIHGDPRYGQKRAIALNAGTTTIRNCHISDIKTVGFDSQAIAGWNGPGPYSIENNYLEAAGEVVMFGGADPSIANLVPSDIGIRANHMARPLAWRDAIVSAPGNVTAVATEGGSLPAGVYGYRVVAQRASGMGTTATSLPSTEVTAVASSGAVNISWAPVADVTEYRVYVRDPSGTTKYWVAKGTAFTHNGATAGTAGNPPTTATRWLVKNIFELKNARRVSVERNLLENNWMMGQVGYAVLFTPRNQDGRCPWCVVEQVQFSHNIVRNVAGGFNISGYDDNRPSQQTNSLVIQDNILYQVTTTLGGSGWGFLMGNGVRDATIDHNTLDFDGTTILYAIGSPQGTPLPMAGIKFTNNATRHNLYGVNGDGASPGLSALQKHFVDIVFTGNWLSGGSASLYPPGNRFEEPFDPKLTPGAVVASGAPGANVGVLLPLIDTITRGYMVLPPQSPRNLRVIGGGGGMEP